MNNLALIGPVMYVVGVNIKETLSLDLFFLCT